MGEAPDVSPQNGSRSYAPDASPQNGSRSDLPHESSQTGSRSNAIAEGTHVQPQRASWRDVGPLQGTELPKSRAPRESQEPRAGSKPPHARVGMAQQNVASVFAASIKDLVRLLMHVNGLNG